MDKVNGIVVHQTDTVDADSVFNHYANPGANGAHFLIDKEGIIYQTASLKKMTNHVGYLQSRCLLTCVCTPTELRHALKLEEIQSPSEKSKAVHRNEVKKSFPDRFPENKDAIGIEIVGRADRENRNRMREFIYEPVTELQNASLKWLVDELTSTFKVSMREVYRHPAIGRKNSTEASTAKW